MHEAIFHYILIGHNLVATFTKLHMHKQCFIGVGHSRYKVGQSWYHFNVQRVPYFNQHFHNILHRNQYFWHVYSIPNSVPMKSAAYFMRTRSWILIFMIVGPDTCLLSKFHNCSSRGWKNMGKGVYFFFLRNPSISNHRSKLQLTFKVPMTPDKTIPDSPVNHLHHNPISTQTLNVYVLANGRVRILQSTYSSTT